MNLGMHLDVSMKLEQKLSPQMIQSLKLLQVNAMQLEQLIKEEVELNPLLEMEDDARQSEEKDRKDESSDSSDSNEKEEKDSSPDSGEALEDRGKDEVDWEEYFKDGFDLGFKQTEDMSAPDPDENYERLPVYSRSMQDYLEEQLQDRMLKDPELVLLVQYLIASLGPDGYLHPVDLGGVPESSVALNAEIAGSSPAEPTTLPETTDDERLQLVNDVIEGRLVLEEAPLIVREAFHILQSFDPPGIGARNLRECLLIQAWRRDKFPAGALSILEDHFELLGNLKIPVLAKKMGRSPAEIQELIKAISTLNPKPGALLGDDPSPVILPDLIVEENDFGELEVKLTRNSAPRLRISRAYAKLLQDARTRKDEKKFIKDRLNSANWLIKSIDQRKNTMLRVMEVILELQKDFFLKGPEHLKPMILQDVADRVKMHISTVNRVTNGKYVETPRGIFELKHFFTSAVRQEDGSDISAAQAREAIRQLVDQEDPKKPLSDQKIADILKARDLAVARRTVAKYREQLNILPARMRKKF